MITLRKADERGHFDHGWLQTWHTFSFGDYRDPAHMGFRALRVINEDFVAPAQGFGEHGHRDMEIVTWVLEGELEHRDSLGNGGIIRPGEVQRMTAGTGIRHSEMNPLPDRKTHLLQIWILPDREGHRPGYEQKLIPVEERNGRLRLIASREGREGSVSYNQDTDLYAAVLKPGHAVEHGLAAGRHAWVQVARGGVSLNGHSLSAGDGAAVSEEKALKIVASEPAEILLFDLG